MQKMEYCRPAADLILFENEDVIMTSDNQVIDPDHDSGCDYNPGHAIYVPIIGIWVKIGYVPCPCWIHNGSSDKGQYSGTEAFDNTEDFDDFSEWRD